MEKDYYGNFREIENTLRGAIRSTKLRGRATVKKDLDRLQNIQETTQQKNTLDIGTIL